MITQEIAISATYRQEFHHKTLKNADQTPVRCRVNGKCRTWKTRPGQFSLPVKHGLKNCFYINEMNAGDWTSNRQEIGA